MKEGRKEDKERLASFMSTFLSEVPPLSGFGIYMLALIHGPCLYYLD